MATGITPSLLHPVGHPECCGLRRSRVHHARPAGEGPISSERRMQADSHAESRARRGCQGVRAAQIRSSTSVVRRADSSSRRAWILPPESEREQDGQLELASSRREVRRRSGLLIGDLIESGRALPSGRDRAIEVDALDRERRVRWRLRRSRATRSSRRGRAGPRWLNAPGGAHQGGARRGGGTSAHGCRHAGAHGGTGTWGSREDLLGWSCPDRRARAVAPGTTARSGGATVRASCNSGGVQPPLLQASASLTRSGVAVVAWGRPGHEAPRWKSQG